ncbi:aspartate/glutamate racemase family protein [Plastoroseomonas arctica]|nr:aspartate/glutamate racemase family protein [Plastoroseomonas arctica]
MRILVSNANMTQAITEACAESARRAAAPGTEIIAATPRFGAAVISSRVENIIAGHALLETIAPFAGQVDAVVLAVSHDTALEAARQLMPCPVVGMTEAACFTACMIGGRFGLVTFGNAETYRELIARHGLSSRLAGTAVIDVTAPQAVSEPEMVAEKLLPEIAALAAAGADSVILAGAALAGFDERLRGRAVVPLLDGIACAVRFAEGLCRAGYPKPSVGSYAPVKGRTLSGVDPGLAGLLGG